MPLRDESKKPESILRSVSNIVREPASTGSLNNNKNTVTKVAHKNRQTCSRLIEVDNIFLAVHMKLIAPKIDLIPAR